MWLGFTLMACVAATCGWPGFATCVAPTKALWFLSIPQKSLVICIAPTTAILLEMMLLEVMLFEIMLLEIMLLEIMLLEIC